MNIKDATQTKDGRLVRIYATDAGGPYPVHGAVYSDRRWKVATWTEEGHAHYKFATGDDLDLTDWRDEIPWECLRDEIQWVARDCNGDFLGFREKPELGVVAWTEGGWIPFTLEGVKMPAGPTSWRDAIAQRPEGR